VSPGLRVAIDARPLDLDFTRHQGVGRYADALVRELAPIAAEHGGELVLLRARGATGSAFGDGAVVGAEMKALRRPPLPNRLAEVLEQALLPLDLRRVRADVHHTLSIYRAPLRPGVPAVVTVHDVIPLMWPGEYFRTGAIHRMLYAAARRASRLIVPCRAVRDDVVRHLGVPAERMAVVPNAAGRHFVPTDAARVRERLQLDGPYIVFVGGLTQADPRKQVELLIDSFTRWSRERGRAETLVLAGRIGPGGAQLVERAERLGARALFTDFIPDEELPALLSGARCLVTPSRYEGFGLTALEAIACGTPVVCFDAGALPEVAGPGGLIAALGDGEALMRAVERLCEDDELRSRLSAAGLEHARGFSWRATAEATWAAYERAA
jgi:glycosyltransferase involved in cell wall biosynthesis